MTDTIACLACGKQFTPWRGKRYCSETCRKSGENQRRRAVPDPMRGDGMGKGTSRPLRGDETALGDPQLAAGCSRIAAMLNPTIEAIRRELAEWSLKDERTIRAIAWRMKVAPTAVREALNA